MWTTRLVAMATFQGHSAGLGIDYGVARFSGLGIGGWRIMHRKQPPKRHRFSPQLQGAESCLAKARGRWQSMLVKHWLAIRPGRTELMTLRTSEVAVCCSRRLSKIIGAAGAVH